MSTITGVLPVFTPAGDMHTISLELRLQSWWKSNWNVYCNSHHNQSMCRVSMSSHSYFIMTQILYSVRVKYVWWSSIICVNNHMGFKDLSSVFVCLSALLSPPVLETCLQSPCTSPSTLPWERFSRCTPQKSSEDCTYFDKVVVTNKK